MGIDGVAIIVVKFLTSENELVPLAFFAFTRQKYVVLFDKEKTCRDVSVIVESSTMRETNDESVATCRRYDSALVEAFQLNVNVVV